MSKSTVSTVDFKIISKNDGSLVADKNADKSFERAHLHVSSTSVKNVTGSKQFKNAFFDTIDVDVSRTSDSCSVSHQSKFLNTSSKLTNVVTDAKIDLQEMKQNSSDKLSLGHVNINSIRNKFDAFTYIIGYNIDIILISETKIDDTFPTAQFFIIKGFSAPYRQDRNRLGGGLLLLVREDVPSRILNSKSKTDITTLSVEINLRKRK